MALKVVKLVALPAALGLGSFRVYAMTEKKTDDMISPRELSIYNPEPPLQQYVAEQPGYLQRGLGRVRVGLQPYVRTAQNACTSVKVGVTSLYQSGQDMYEFLRDPPPGFLPRVGVITVSGLTGLILARKGSRLKRIGFPLALTTVGAAVCYPRETVGVLKVAGKKVYSTSSLVASVIKSKPKEDDVPLTSFEPITPNLGATTSKEHLKSEPAEAIIREEAIAPVALISEVTPELDDAVENVISTGEPADDVPLSEAAPTAEVTPLSDDVPQEATVVPSCEESSIGDLAIAQEEAIPVEDIPNTETVIAVEDAATASSEVREDLAIAEVVPVPDLTREEEPVEDTLVLEVDVPPDVASEEVTPVSEATPTEVIETSPVAGASLSDIIPEEVATLLQIDAASELPLTLETSPEVKATLLPDVPPEADLVVEVASVEVAPAVDLSSSALDIIPVDEALDASASLLAETALEAAPKQGSETEANYESTPAAEVAPEAIDSAASELAPTEREATPVVLLPAKEPATFSLTEIHPDEEYATPADIAASATASEEPIPLPTVVEEISSLPTSDKVTTFCPSTSDEIISVPPPVIDKPTPIADAEQETTSSSPAVDITPTALAEGQTTPPSFATEDTTPPVSVVDEAVSPPPAEEETTSPAAALQSPASTPDSVKEKPRFVPDPSLVDHGQAHPEDADMYSTRG